MDYVPKEKMDFLSEKNGDFSEQKKLFPKKNGFPEGEKWISREKKMDFPRNKMDLPKTKQEFHERKK